MSSPDVDHLVCLLNGSRALSSRFSGDEGRFSGHNRESDSLARDAARGTRLGQNELGAGRLGIELQATFVNGLAE
jgi:hypothetical protein